MRGHSWTAHTFYSLWIELLPALGFNSSQQEDIGCNADGQVDAGNSENPSDLMRSEQVAGDGGGLDSRDLVGEVHDAAHTADVVAACNKPGHGPAYRSGGGEAADRDADPDERVDGAVGVGC